MSKGVVTRIKFGYEKILVCYFDIQEWTNVNLH